MLDRLAVPLSAALTAIALCALAGAPASADVEVTVNGSAVDLSPPPIIEAGRVFVPLRGVFEQLGASVVYSDGEIDATGNGRDISLHIGSTEASVNGQPQTIDVAPFIVGASTYVPLRFVSEALGDSVNWDEADSIAAIDSVGGPATYYSPGTASYVDSPPPPIPDYDQPYVPAPDYIWQPGYWAWGAYGYYWVPGTWVEPPQPGYSWTPGYWAWNNGGYNWNPGYWALLVGFYGGVNYGCGYFGHGYDGGRWNHDRFEYNTYVTNVNTTIVNNVYVDRTVIVDRSPGRVSYNGGQNGVQVRPTAQELAAARGRHLGMTPAQAQHLRAAEQDRRLLATVNHDKPPVLAVARPLTTTNRPAGFVPVKPSDRVNPLANVSPVRVTPRAPARPPVAHAPAAAAPPVRHPPGPAAPVTQPTPAHAPVAHAPVAHVPVAHAPVGHVPVAHAPVGHVPVAHAPVAHAPVVHAPVAQAPVVHAHVSHAPPAAASAPNVEPAARVPAVHAARPTVHEPPAARIRVAPPVRAAPADRATPDTKPHAKGGAHD
jgi:hypothetical protein